MREPIFGLVIEIVEIVDVHRRTSMNFVYGMLQDGKNDFRTSCSKRDLVFGPVIEIFEKQSMNRLHGPHQLAVII